MSRRHQSVKTEHSGAKKGGSGFYGHHADAKAECKSIRRNNDKAETIEQMSEVEDEQVEA